MAILRYALALSVFASALSFGATIPATVAWYVAPSEFGPGGYYQSASAACSDYAKNYGVGTFDPSNQLLSASGTLPGAASCTLTKPWAGWGFSINSTSYCPTGTLSNVEGVMSCTVPDPTCNAGESVSFSIFSGFSVGANQVIGGDANPYSNGTNRCNGTCSFNVSSISNCPSQVGTVDSPKPITCHGTGVLTGSPCSVNESVASTAPTIPNHRPKCAADEGVLTSSSGTVACVPSGIPAEKPVVTSSKSTEQFPDGSSKTTETTYTKDPVSQVQDTQQTITNTPAAGGGSGQAGPVGVVTASGSKAPSSGDDKQAAKFCEENGQLQICKGDMNKEETQLAIKALLDPKDPADKSSLDQAKTDYETQANDYKDKLDAIGAKQQNNEGIFSWALIPDPPPGGCAGFSGSFMGKQVNLDWCSTLEKIREIAGYAFYILTAFGLFRIFANMKGGE